MRTEEQVNSCARQLKTISNPVRLNIIRLLQGGASNVTGLLENIPIEQNLMSHHLKKLKKAGLVKSKRVGKTVRYELVSKNPVSSTTTIDLGCCRLSFD